MGLDSHFEKQLLVVGCQGSGSWEVMVEARAGLESVGFARTEGMDLCWVAWHVTLSVSHEVMGQTQKSCWSGPSGRTSELDSWTKPFLNSTQLNAASLRKKGKLQGWGWCAGPLGGTGGAGATSQEGRSWVGSPGRGMGAR